jgi:hypothetical protein
MRIVEPSGASAITVARRPYDGTSTTMSRPPEEAVGKTRISGDGTSPEGAAFAEIID